MLIQMSETAIKGLRPKLLPALSILLLLTLTVVIFQQQLFDHWTFPWDFVGGYSATPAFVAATIGHGHFLSWSPYVASGFPVDVDPQAGIYFPGWWLLGFLRIPATLRVVTTVQVAHVLFGSCGVLALARARRLAWSWATVAAVAYLFFGGFYGEAEHADIIRGFAYAPWLLWALTPPTAGSSWTRLAAVPPLAWLIVSGAYPGQVVSFGLTGLVYLAVSLRVSGRETWRRYRGALMLATAASAAACAAVLLPYVRAEQANELYRVWEPTAAVRAGASLAPRDLLGLYLNNFSWTYDGTITAWAVGIPVLIGLACARRPALRRQAPLLACGAMALVLAMTPKIAFIGKAMVAVRPLFPSRFPASDYKAIVVIAMVVLAADSWGEIATSRRGVRWRAVVIGGLLTAGALLAPTTYAHPTREQWLVFIVILAGLALVLVPLPTRMLICVLMALIVIDGAREINDYRLLGSISPWQASPSAAAPYRARDVYVRKLPAQLTQALKTRPARLAPHFSLNHAATGSDPDASGWVADGYHLVDYGGTIERSLWRAEHNPAWLNLLLEPWHAYTYPCATVGCTSGSVRLPAASTWQPSPGVQTVSYGNESVTYAVSITQPELMVENELAVNGWQANTSLVHSVNTGSPLRAWRLSPGDYRFTATFREPGRALQVLVAILALLAWIGCAYTLLQARRTERLAKDKGE